MLIEADSKEDAIAALDALAAFEKYGLRINVKKTQIITDQKNMLGVTDIAGIPVTDR